jgi:Putative zinc-finger
MRHSADHDDHEQAWALIPWYANGRIADADRQRLDAHSRVCARCRDELQAQIQLCTAMLEGHGVEHMPTASLKRLQLRLDALTGATAGTPGTVARDAGRRVHLWQTLMVASIALLALTLGVVSTVLWGQIDRRAGAANYYTVSAAQPRVPNAVIRAVFVPAMTVAELQALLGQAELKIVSGPTDAGVYSLARTSDRPVAVSLAILREHAAVAFAESQ